MAGNSLLSHKWLQVHGSRLQIGKLQIVLPQFYPPQNDILKYFLGLFSPPNIFFFTLLSAKPGSDLEPCLTLLRTSANLLNDNTLGGATQMARGGIRLVHGLTKSTLITYFSGMKKDPIYAFLHAFFLICLSCSFQNLSI